MFLNINTELLNDQQIWKCLTLSYKVCLCTVGKKNVTLPTKELRGSRFLQNNYKTAKYELISSKLWIQKRNQWKELTTAEKFNDKNTTLFQNKHKEKRNPELPFMKRKKTHCHVYLHMVKVSLILFSISKGQNLRILGPTKLDNFYICTTTLFSKKLLVGWLVLKHV